ncbi:glutamine--fructose-6-phosphate transaminase (isomerizing) [bacterium]|nr:glutamine--fructose-6-phosphate transaminase (isomerizing) [bacterium]
MCGIVGYIGDRPAVPILMEGLEMLEYRGYDSAGLAIWENNKLLCIKQRGKIARLKELIAHTEYSATSGIAHTRWATHGEPSELNAHPQMDGSKKIALVHNGIIENYYTLKKYLEKKGHRFETETDTEIIAHLIEEAYDGDFLEAVRVALLELEGTYGLGILFEGEPGKVYAARHGSPLLIGKGEGEYFLASDAAAIIRHTNQVIYLKEKEIACLSRDGYDITTLDRKTVVPMVEKLSWDLHKIEKGGHDHFMLKEIYEQPITLQNAFRGRLDEPAGSSRLNGLKPYFSLLRESNRIIITACGTSFHASLIGEYLIEELADIPVEVEYASEFRYRNPVINPGNIVFVISQSGETADTLAALREAQRKGAVGLGICNVVGSSIARETDAGVYIHAGPEIGVASTKAFTSQVMTLNLIALMLGRMKGMGVDRGTQILKEIQMIPVKVANILENEKNNLIIKNIADQYYQWNNFLYLGRSYNYPVALEGALKLKEISYIHAEGYPAAEMKHGPIALIDENMPVIFLATDDPIYEKIISNIKEVKTRGGNVIAVATEGNNFIRELVDHVIYIPPTEPFLVPLLSVIPLQLLAYHIAVNRGCDIDQPRNLAKSVTVE